MNRWTLHDPLAGVTYTLRRNPKNFSGTVNPKTTRTAGGPWGVRAFRKGPQLAQFSFTGLIVTKEEYDAFLVWSKKDLIWLTDHRGEIHEIIPVGFEPTPRRTGRPEDVESRWEYTFKALKTRRVVL